MISPRIHQAYLLKQRTTYNDSKQCKTILKNPQQSTMIKKLTMTDDPTKSPKRTTKTHIDKKVSTYSNQKQSSTTQDII